MKAPKPERLTREREQEYLEELRAVQPFSPATPQPEISRRLRVVHCKFYPHMKAIYAELGYSL